MQIAMTAMPLRNADAGQRFLLEKLFADGGKQTDVHGVGVMIHHGDQIVVVKRGGVCQLQHSLGEAVAVSACGST